MLKELTPSSLAITYFIVGRTKTNGFLFLQLGVYIALEICSQAFSLDARECIEDVEIHVFLKTSFFLNAGVPKSHMMTSRKLFTLFETVALEAQS